MLSRRPGAISRHKLNRQSRKLRSTVWKNGCCFLARRNDVAGTIPTVKSYSSCRQQRGRAMPTSSGHTTAILASKVRGTPVYNTDGDKIGTVEDVVLDKMSNNIMFAVLGSGGVLGMGEKFRPIPWSVLDYDPNKGGYIVPLSKDTLENAPAYRMEDLTSEDGEGAIRAEAFSYYHAEQYW